MVDQSQMSKNIIAIGAGALIAIGAASIVYSVTKSNAKQRKAQEIFMNKPLRNNRRSKYDDDVPLFLSKQQPRRVVLYFDQNDELVDEETAKMDQNNYYHKYHAVEVDYGCILTSEDLGIKDKITKDIFCGE
jgi:hypothetical protein